MDSDLNQKYSPDFKDRYQIELLLQELDVSDGPSEGLSLSPPRPQPQGGCVDSQGHSSCVQDQEKALDKYEHVVRGLQKRGQQVVPLKYRRETPLKPIPVEALCDFEGDQVSWYPRSLFVSLKGLKGDVAGCRASNTLRSCAHLCRLGSLSAGPQHRPTGCPDLLCYQFSNQSHSSRNARKGSHWPSLSRPA